MEQPTYGNIEKVGDILEENRNLSEQIKNIAFMAGADLVGFAPADELEAKAPEGHKPSDLLPGSKSVIVVAGGNSLNEDRLYLHGIGSLSTLSFIELKDSVKLERRRTRACVNAVHKFLIDNGFKSVIESHGFSDILSFKQASFLGGLGVFGKGDFIIHPEFGTINVLGCIATDAVLKYDEPMDANLCGDCMECIKACKYGTYKKKSDKYIWNENKCRFYSTVKKTKDTTYGPCNGDCINVCPIGNGIKKVSKESDTSSMIQTLDEIMEEIKPFLESSLIDEKILTNIQEVFGKRSFKPANYEGLKQVMGFALWITDEELQKSFQCKKIWVEFSSENEKLFDRLYDLRDVLNHEWSILVIKEDGTYDFYRPLIWSKIQGIKDITLQI